MTLGRAGCLQVGLSYVIQSRQLSAASEEHYLLMIFYHIYFEIILKENVSLEKGLHVARNV